jgi:23S rRNA (uracil1939-C5)-methyltransferase
MTESVRARIDAMAFKGYGVSRIDGKVVFIPYAAAGDEAWVEILDEKKTYAMGRLVEILTPSPWRVKPPCPYFGRCGGCQWQHIEGAQQVELKKEILKDLLMRLGGLKEIPPITSFPSPDPYDYRTRVQVKVKGQRLGYFRERSHQLVDIEGCPIAHPLVNEIIQLLRKEIASFPSIEGIEINISPEEGKAVLIFYLLIPSPGRENSLEGLLKAHPVVKGIVIKGKRETRLLGEPHLSFTIPFNLTLHASPGTFFQVNLKQNAKLIQKVLEFSGAKRDEKALDLYSGVGNFTLPVATVTQEAWGVEENRTAVNDARRNAELSEIKNCHFIQGRAEEVLRDWKRKKPDLVILDPPRMGCKRIVGQLVGLKPRRIVYVSCEPTTLARDFRLFSQKRYFPHELALIDMFPQTYHMEVVGLLTQA